MILYSISVLITKTSLSIELKGIQFFYQLMNHDFTDKKKTQYPAPTGSTEFSFVDFVSYKDRTICGLDESLVPDTDKVVDGRKIIKVKCQAAKGNGTLYLIDSLSTVMSLLGPIGNSMKPDYPGNCVVMLFYSKSCAGSSLVIPHYNALARNFPDIKVAAIDAFEYHALNTEFGIIGIPTIMLFHQGRPITKFNNTSATVNNFIKFIQKHTNLKPGSQNVFVTSEDFRGPLPSTIEEVTDYYLYLSWIFIIICCTYYFTKSKLYTQFVEQLKRMWRESEEIMQN